jgi:hypothetical protein
MASRLQLAERRGQLIAQSAAQRAQLASASAPLAQALGVVDQGIALTQRASNAAKRHPAAIGALVTILFVLKPRRLWRWGQRAWMLRKGWMLLRERLQGR